MSNPHIFVSYSRVDETRVRSVLDGLRREGVKVWFDRDNISPGEFWKDAIRKAIKSGARFLWFHSKSFNESEEGYIHEELTVAIELLRQKPFDTKWFIPLKLDDSDIPEMMIDARRSILDIDWVDLFADEATALDRLLLSLKNAGVVESNLEVASDVATINFIRSSDSNFKENYVVFRSNGFDIAHLHCTKEYKSGHTIEITSGPVQLQAKMVGDWKSSARGDWASTGYRESNTLSIILQRDQHYDIYYQVKRSLWRTLTTGTPDIIISNTDPTSIRGW